MEGRDADPKPGSVLSLCAPAAQLLSQLAEDGENGRPWETSRPPLLTDAETRPREGRDKVPEELGLCSARAQDRDSLSVLGAL